MAKNNQVLFFYFAVNLLTVVLSFYYQKQQTQMNYEECTLCDGKQYLQSYDYFRGETQQYNVKFPFNSRIFVPWVLSFWSKEHLAEGFWYFHLCFTLLAVNALVYLWSGLGIAWHLQGIGMAWLLLHWVGIIRYNQYDWITVDVPLYFFQTLFLIFVVRGWLFGLLPLAILATAQKESFIPIVVLLLCWQVYNYFTHKERISIWVLLAVVASVSTKIALDTYFFAFDAAARSSVSTLVLLFARILLEPLILVRLFVAFFVGFGAWAWLAIKHLTPQTLQQPPTLFLLLYSLMFIAFGVLAGGDITRIVFLGFPFIMTFLLYVLHLQKVSNLALTIAGICSLPLLRLLSVIDAPNDKVRNWLIEFADWGIVNAWAVYAVLTFWIVHKGTDLIKTVWKTLR